MNMIWFGWDMFKHLIVHVQLCTINLGQPWDHHYCRRPPGTFLKRYMFSLPCSKPPQYIHSSEKQDHWARKSHLESGLKGSFRQRKNYPDLMEIIHPLFSSSNSPEIASNHSADSQKEGSNLCINRPKTHPIATWKFPKSLSFHSRAQKISYLHGFHLFRASEWLDSAKWCGIASFCTVLIHFSSPTVST